MARRIKISIALKIAILIIVTFIIILVLLSIHDYQEEKEHTFEFVQSNANSIIEGLRLSIEPLLKKEDIKTVQRLAISTAVIHGIKRISVVNDHLIIIADSKPQYIGKPTDKLRLIEALRKKEPVAFIYTSDGRKIYRLTYPLRKDFYIDSKSDAIGGILLEMDISKAESISRGHLLFMLTSFVTGALLLGFILFYILKRIVVNPVVSLTIAAESIAKGKLDARVNVKQKDELGQLAASFNKMTEDLRGSRDTLMQSQEKYKTLVDSINGIVWELDARTFQFSFVSKQVERLLGYPVEHWLRESTFWKDHIHPDDQEEAVAFREKVTAEKRTYEFEYRMITADGHMLWLRDIATAVVENGQTVKLRGVMVDVNKHKKAETRLIKLNECFLSFGTDTIDNINRLTALCGELLGATCALYNRLDKGMLCSWGKWNAPTDYNPVDKPEGHICYDVIQQGRDDVLVVHNLPQTTYAQTDPNVIPYKLQTYVGKAVKFADVFVGSLCVVYQRDFVPEEADRRLMGIIASAIAVEEVRKMADEALKRAYKDLKESQLQLVQAEKLAVIGQLAAGVAHEINNPLNVISGNTEILLMESKDEDVKRATKVIMEQVKRAAGITERLLQFSRKIKPKTGRVDINKAIEDTLYLLGYQTKYQNIKIIKRLDLSLPEVMADSSQMQEVFLNIILNAVQAMPNGGELTLKTYAKEISKFTRKKTDVSKQGSEVVVIEFRDTGEGIPEEKLGNIFDPFFSTKEQGAGLGLSICHGIIKAHQGIIKAQSKAGEGTIFIIQLPAQKKKGAQNG